MSTMEKIKGVLFRSQWLTSKLRSARALAHHLRSTPHETDFYFLRDARYKNGFLLDLGANIGNSALSVHKVQPSMRIFSIEANPACESGLRMTKRLLGERFDFRLVGVGATSGNLVFHVPVRSSRMLLEEGTFDRSTLVSRGTSARLGREGVDYQVKELSISMVTVDSLNVHPTVVKMDLQGLEMQALVSMKNTIERCWPVFMIEIGERHEEVTAHLTSLGYRPNHWNGEKLVPGAPEGTLNAIFTRY